MTEALKEQVSSLPEEMQQEVESLQHGMAVLDLFSEEVRQEERRAVFLIKTRLGTDTREAILEGPSYEGDEEKLDLARMKARNAYGLKAIRRQAMYEHALFLGIEAQIDKKRGMVITKDPEQQRRLSLEHGTWRANYGSRARNQAREMKRDSLEREILKITGESREEIWPAVNLEDRAVLLTRALNGMARRSMLSGLGIGIADERYSEGIRERYGDETELIDRASARKVDRLYKKTRQDFNVASGYLEVRDKGSKMRRLLMERRFHKAWKEFAGQFEHALRQEERIEFRKVLRAQIPEDRLPETAIDQYN